LTQVITINNYLYRKSCLFEWNIYNDISYLRIARRNRQQPICHCLSNEVRNCFCD